MLRDSATSAISYRAHDAAAEEIPLLLRSGAFIVVHRRTIMVTALIIAAISALVALMRPREYVATVVFTPSSDPRPGIGAAGGIASQLGLQFNLGAGGDDIDFYAALIESRELLLRTVEWKYTVRAKNGAPQSGDLIRLLEIKGDSPADQRNRAIEKLGEMIAVRTNPRANIIEVKVSSRWPDLSEEIAARIFSYVNEFNLERRQSQAAAERKFVQARVEAESTSLAESEAAATEFLRTNRTYLNSPTLSLRYDRLRRNVDRHQEVFTSLLQSLEHARLDEVRNTPVVTAIDLPAGSAVPKPKGVILGGFIGLFFGAFLGVGLASLRDLLRKARHDYPGLPWRQRTASGHAEE
jgi:uncharacterized protein involved in exopolysaccharide biosynthesis